MEEVLKNAAKLLHEGNPEEALLLLNELNEITPQSDHLKYACKKSLSEQYLWILNEAFKNNQLEEVKKYVTRYKHLIGHDDKLLIYETMIKTSSILSKGRTSFKNFNNIGELALLPIIFLVLFLLRSAFWEQLTGWDLLENWSKKLDLDHPSFLLSYIGEFIGILYTVSAAIVFFQIDRNNKNLLNPYNICLFAWGALSLFASISVLISGFSIDSFMFLQTVRKSIAIANFLLIIFLVKKMIETKVYKIPLIISIVATTISWGRSSLWVYIGYIQNQGFYKNLDLLYKISNVAWYGSAILMVLSFLLIFLVSKKLNQKGYGTN